MAMTLCFVASVCAHSVVDQRSAWLQVQNLQKQTLNVVLKAQDKYSDAEGTKNTVESRKAKAENAVTAAETAASGNREAEAFANKAKDAKKQCDDLYPEAKQKAQEAFEHTKRLLSEARTLDSNADIKVVPNAGADKDYSTVSERATALKTEAEGFEEKFRAATALITAAKAELRTISDRAEDAQVAKYKVDAIVKVVEMGEMLKKADADIESLEQKKDKVNTVVQEIRDIFGNVTHEVYLANMGILSNAEGDLRIISNRVKEVKQEKKKIVKQKGYADETLKEIKKDTQESPASKNFKNIHSYAKNAEKSLEKINNALENADIESGNANSRKESVVKRLSKNSGKSKPQKDKPQEKPQPLEKDGTATPTSKSPEQKVVKNSEQHEKDGAATPVEKGGIPTFGGNNDSAITASFTLLLALIVFCAALH